MYAVKDDRFCFKDNKCILQRQIKILFNKMIIGTKNLSIENVWAGFNNIFRVFFMSLTLKNGILLLLYLFAFFVYACTCSLILWCIIFYTKAKSYKNILAIKFWLLESNSYLFNVLLILQ